MKCGVAIEIQLSAITDIKFFQFGRRSNWKKKLSYTYDKRLVVSSGSIEQIV